MTSKKINLRLGSTEDIYAIADIYADSVAQLCPSQTDGGANGETLMCPHELLRPDAEVRSVQHRR